MTIYRWDSSYAWGSSSQESGVSHPGGNLELGYASREVLTFDGADASVSTPYGANFGTGPFTVMGWLTLDALPSNRAAVLATYDGDTGIILGPAYGSWRLWAAGEGSSFGTPGTGSWHHLAGVRRSDGTLETWLDGTLLGSSDSSGSSVSNSTDLTIGRESGGYYLDGSLSDIRLYGRALSASELNALASGVNQSVSGTGPVVHYPLDGNALDSSENNNDGTIHGATTTTTDKLPTGEFTATGDWRSKKV